MSDFNRNNDPAYRPVEPTISDPYVRDPARGPVVEDRRSFGMGSVIAALVLAAIAIGGFYAYNHSDSIRTASNNTTTTSTVAPTPPASVPDNNAATSNDKTAPTSR